MGYETDQQLYEAFLQVLQEDGHITSLETLSSFKFALSVRSAAPRIEAHYHYYDNSIAPLLNAAQGSGGAQDAVCPVWVHFDGKQYCSSTLEKAQQDIGPVRNPEALPFDRILEDDAKLGAYPSVLYADITNPAFGQFHQTIRETAKEGQTSYRVRYRRSLAEEKKPLTVSGYGIGLALKRTDYIVIDDRKAETEASKDEPASNSEVETSLEDGDLDDLKPLSSSELLGLGFKTTTYIMGSENPLATLERVSQDFPKYSSSIAKRNASKEVVEEHTTNRDIFLPAGYNVLWMNGQQVQAREMDAYNLLEQLRRERSTVGSLRSLGFTGREAVKILSHPSIAASKTEGDSPRYDYRDDPEGGRVIIWLNDLEKDKRYAAWPNHTSALLQRMWPGQLPQIRRNLHNVVLPVDLSDVQDVGLVVEQLLAFVKRVIPVRFGLVPMTHTGPAAAQAKIIYHLLETYGLGAVISYLEACFKARGRVTSRQMNFEAATKDAKLRRDKEPSLYHVVLDSVSSDDRIGKTHQYLRRLEADAIPPVFFANGVALLRNDGWLQAMSGAVDLDLRKLQQAVYEEAVSDDAWLPSVYMDKANLYRNALIVPEDESTIRFIDAARMASKYAHIAGGLPRFTMIQSSNKSATPELYIVADIDTREGSELLEEALMAYRDAQDVELVILHSPGPKESLYFPFSAMISESMRNTEEPLSAFMLTLFLALAKSMDEQGNLSQLKAQYTDDVCQQAREWWQLFQPMIKQFGFENGQSAITLNSRVVGPIPKTTKFAADDFKQLLQFESVKRLDVANAVLTDLALLDKISSPQQGTILVSAIAQSTISDIPEGIFESGPTARIDKFEVWAGDHTLIQTGNADISSIHLVASIDPTSQIAQRWIPILRVLSELEGIHLKLYLNPKEKMQELPIKRFYRHVLDSTPSFTDDGELRGMQATFDRLPREALLNLALDVPPAWVVAPKESIHDLDNIKLSALKEGANVDAIYGLEHILIEGHSRDVTVGPPPRGVQLHLGTSKDPEFTDTIIMANLGYFQFKANPGYWNLKLQQGRSSKIFTIDSAGQLGYSPVSADESTEITLMSFQGKTLYPRFSRKPGMETEDVLEDTKTSILKSGSAAADYVNKASSWASSMLSQVGLGLTKKTEHADINIFSVASGHLYERMLNIMMVSVMRHTDHTVKFWFIEQFLSPSFKASLPYIAAHYNFKYQLITYKWPHWLRQQTEKQREIWGYKSLFLDVLFPTSLDKVIFVDADQIVRTDMYDLVQFDLEGAPYGFTPMCDSRTEMEGFRFWKQGYWANFLRGLPYHISALYVVDLRKFRELAAGDRLRGQYQQLSADPGSLSNLDQDLPNHMQHVLQIKSLPQEWLWCETWCSDEALVSARTIDLCNNPETKEPKLARARRQVPEWTELDEEIAGVLRDSHAGEEVRGGVQEVMIEGKFVAGGGGKDEEGAAEGVKENVQKQDEERQEKRRVKEEL